MRLLYGRYAVLTPVAVISLGWTMISANTGEQLAAGICTLVRVKSETQEKITGLRTAGIETRASCCEFRRSIKSAKIPVDLYVSVFLGIFAC